MKLCIAGATVLLVVTTVVPRRHVYATRDAARSDVFDYIEIFYNARRRHGFNNQLSPVEYEEQYEKRLASV